MLRGLCFVRLSFAPATGGDMGINFWHKKTQRF
jgi:hypothetical protein